ncbi:uncharacterized protein LOC106179247 [Lingula anatina]|uniref:Uncharacterized protein LOC106179247 n=1 Tax=Lingula anatina TaxID=7574 RepID=A0A1S3K6W3_LINAN|nr:uncharacterized protein LOC106179247 [Lingula anatina]|eukprot:XP_013418242.1 uncharacterized protein LOC106179247 [Lingula anatina]
MGENTGALCCSCCLLLSVVGLAVCGLTFGILCLDAEKRLENKACQGVVNDAAAITLIVFGGLATLCCCCCCCYGCLSGDDEDSEDSPPDYEETGWSSTAFLTAQTHTVVHQLHVIRHVTIGKLGLNNE